MISNGIFVFLHKQHKQSTKVNDETISLLRAIYMTTSFRHKLPYNTYCDLETINRKICRNKQKSFLKGCATTRLSYLKPKAIALLLVLIFTFSILLTVCHTLPQESVRLSKHRHNRFDDITKSVKNDYNLLTSKRKRYHHKNDQSSTRHNQLVKDHGEYRKNAHELNHFHRFFTSSERDFPVSLNPIYMPFNYDQNDVASSTSESDQSIPLVIDRKSILISPGKLVESPQLNRDYHSFENYKAKEGSSKKSINLPMIAKKIQTSSGPETAPQSSPIDRGFSMFHSKSRSRSDKNFPLNHTHLVMPNSYVISPFDMSERFTSANYSEASSTRSTSASQEPSSLPLMNRNMIQSKNELTYASNEKNYPQKYLEYQLPSQTTHALVTETDNTLPFSYVTESSYSQSSKSLEQIGSISLSQSSEVTLSRRRRHQVAQNLTDLSVDKKKENGSSIEDAFDQNGEIYTSDKSRSFSSDQTKDSSYSANSSLQPSKDSANNLDPLYVSFRDRSRFWIQRVLVPILMVVGLFGNSITMIIMTRRRMRSTTNLYLAALAFVDMLYLVLTFVLGLSHYPNMANKKYHAYWSMKPFLMMLTDSCSNTSVWLTVTFTIERYIAVRYPIQGKVWCTEARAKALIAGVFIFGIAFASPVPFEWRVVERRPLTEATTTSKSISSTNIATEATFEIEGSSNYRSIADTLLTNTSDYSIEAKNAISQSIAQTSVMQTVISASSPDIGPVFDENTHDQTVRNRTVNINSEDSNMNESSRDHFVERIDNNRDRQKSNVVTSLKDDNNSTEDLNKPERGGTLIDDGVTLALDYSEFGENETYKTCYYWSTAVIFYFIPFISLMFFNGYLIKSVHQSRKQRTKMTNQPRKVSKKLNQGRIYNQTLHTENTDGQRNDIRHPSEMLEKTSIQLDDQHSHLEAISIGNGNAERGRSFISAKIIPNMKVNFMIKVFQRLSIRKRKSVPHIDAEKSLNVENDVTDTKVVFSSLQQPNFQQQTATGNLASPTEREFKDMSPPVSNSNSSSSVVTCKQVPLLGVRTDCEVDSVIVSENTDKDQLELKEKPNISCSSRDSSPTTTHKSPLNIPKGPAQQQRQQQNQALASSKQERRITIMLIAVVILFLVCQIPSAAMIIYTSVNAPEPNTNEHALVLAFGNIFNFLMAVNAAGNFVLYSFLSQKYRRTFMLLFCPGLRSTRNLRNADRARNSATNYNQQAHNKNADRSYHSKSTTIGSYSGRSTNTTIVLSTPGDVQKRKPLIQRPNKEDDLRNKQRARQQFDAAKRREFVEDVISANQLVIINEPFVRNNIQEVVTREVKPEDDNNNMNISEAVCIIDLKPNSNFASMISNGQANV